MSGHPVLPAEPITLPLLPLRDVVVFPHMVIPLFVGRPMSIKALEAAMEAGRQIMLVAQRAAGIGVLLPFQNEDGWHHTDVIFFDEVGRQVGGRVGDDS